MTMTAENFDLSARPADPAPMPVAVQVLSTLLFAAFAIPVTIVALNVFWPAGILIALILAWRGGFAPTGTPSAAPRNLDEAVKSLVPTTAQKAAATSSGNANFDAYRADMLERLEIEQQNFEGFLTRLRDAKDKSEFDDFMDARAKRPMIDDDA
ncbi:DUF2852 domain-containing protein [Octadecabacter sp. R77987]|uniref:DUF2852 domain-containing protein n=1 Tax=Octadecabacter sp. R77987 TaxID=3093874 RepID=UPI00366F9554